MDRGKDKIIPMKICLVEKTNINGLSFLLTRTENPAGKNCFTAKASIGEDEIISFDHWNLSVLKKRMKEWLPLIIEARQLRQTSLN